MKCIYQHAQPKRNVYIIESIKFVSIVYMYMFKPFMDQFISLPFLQYHLFKPFN